MRKAAYLAGLAILAVSLTGCGGQLGHNSPVQVRMETSTNTIDFSNLHVIISPNNGASTSSNAASDVQTQTWANNTVTGTLKEIDFTTTSQQVPYFLYVQNTSPVQEEVRLRVFMDGNNKYDHVLTIPASSTVQENTIFRNNVQNP
ncbi:MAG TPA: hypothetical protein VG820_01700 [Fimbriimonadaceae bacterium]|nr:hypothetical protein [Fimbriimonadaceae bacterium]